MSSLGQKGRSCGHVMALFDGHSRYAHCREKGPRIGSMCFTPEMFICSALTPELVQQLAIPKCQSLKENKAKSDKNLDLVDLSDIAVISVIASEAMDMETE